MSDLISRKAAIDAIQQHREGVLGGYEYDEGVAFVYAAAHNHIIDVIKRLPSAQPEQRWIPCSERLPEKAYGQYWVCTDTGYQCQCRWTDDIYGLGSNGEWAWKIFDIPQYSHVVAWMQLPEPYAERREE